LLLAGSKQAFLHSCTLGTHGGVGAILRFRLADTQAEQAIQ
jgi:hypothetical protein